jgi:hypothetical protein
MPGFGTVLAASSPILDTGRPHRGDRSLGLLEHGSARFPPLARERGGRRIASHCPASDATSKTKRKQNKNKNKTKPNQNKTKNKKHKKKQQQ